jgi:hypothetical protein
MTGYTFELGRVVAGVQLVNLTLHQFDENDYRGRIFSGECPACPALVDGIIVDAPQSVKDVLAGEAAQSRLLDFQSKGLNYKASKFRSLMQGFFGPDAELDRTKTADYVTYYFMNATGLSGDQVRDGIFLKELFAELSAWNGGQTWTLFESPLKDVIP